MRSAGTTTSRYAAPGWHLVVPVKGGPAAKSRLHPPRGVTREALAHAIALDTLDAVLGTVPAAQVVVVTSDDSTAAQARRAGARPVPDPGRGLAAAIRAGVSVLRDVTSGPAGILLGDLPALRPADLTDALDQALGYRRAFVPDAAGTGTVLLTAGAAGDLRPRFGVGSAAAHARQSTRLDLDLPHLRTDVDDDASLAAAVALGLGPRTTGVLQAAAS